MSQESQGNRGINFSGGSMSVGTLAVGDNAQARSVHIEDGGAQSATIEGLRVRIDQLVGLYRSEPHGLSPDEEQSITAIQAETRKAQPDKAKVGSLLDRLAGSAKSVGTIATAIIAVKKLVEIILI